MTLTEEIITIGLCALASFSTRALPFIFISDKRPVSPLITYLGNVLPLAIFGMLVVYCLKDVSIFSGAHGLPELIAIIVTGALHIRYRQMILSMFLGTACYMLIIQLTGA